MSSTEVMPTRQPHAVLDLASRHLKAKKIEKLLNLSDYSRTLHVLEIGTGSGGIANYFGTHPRLRCQVVATDVRDNRQIRDGYEYHLTQGVKLPFDDRQFDVVISNHVIEHVGNTAAQQEHLNEIFRVLKPDGAGYLAVPNRWMVTEPHYRLKFLSWLPHGWRSTYLRLRGKGDFYDCEPLQMRELERMCAAAGLIGRNLCIEAMRITFEIERPASFVARLIRRIPNMLVVPLKPVIPTLVYHIQRMAAQV